METYPIKKLLNNTIEIKICENSIASTGSNISHLKILKQHNRDENSITSTGSSKSYQTIAKQHNRDENSVT